MDLYKKTKWHSYKTGALCKGCKQCVRGEKLVLFITGLCGRNCFYCPISSDKYAKDVVFANEWKIKDVSNPVELFEEVKMTNAKGAGITGGDPLLRLSRTLNYIKMLKKEFGSSFHIHLYTSLDFVSFNVLEKLFKSGLDEIRFHPSLTDDSFWDRIIIAKKFDWSVGVEIPVIPKMKKESVKLITFLSNKIDFLNLNELEFSDTSSPHYDMSGFFRRDNLSYGVKGSESLSFELLGLCSKLGIRAHYCTALLKNKVQVGERLKKRALNVAKKFDFLTEDYLLYRGVIYLNNSVPGFGYGQGLSIESDVTSLNKAKKLLFDLGLSKDDLFVDEPRNRILTSYKFVQRHSKKIKEKGLVPAISEEYPSSDYFCVELEFL